jgi:hypothetical protein
MTKRPEEEKVHKPRTDLPPERGPAYEGYSGTEEERGARGDQTPEEEASRRARQEDAAGGDREIG